MNWLHGIWRILRGFPGGENPDVRVRAACHKVVGRETGSGFFISRKGLAITAHHVLYDMASTTALGAEVFYKMQRALTQNNPARSYPVQDLAYMELSDIPVEFPTIKILPLDRVARDTPAWWRGRHVIVGGYPQGEFHLLHGVTDPKNPIEKLKGGHRLIRLILESNNEIERLVDEGDPKPLIGQSGGPVYDEETERVIAVVQSFYMDRGADGYWRVNAVPVGDYPLLHSPPRYRNQKKKIIAAGAIVAALLVFTFCRSVVDVVVPPSLDVDIVETALEDVGGMVNLSGTSTRIAGHNLDVLWFVNPMADGARKWYLQVPPRGMESPEDGGERPEDEGEWHATVQLGSAQWPPSEGQTFAIAAVVASPDRTQLIVEQCARSSDNSLLELPDSHVIGAHVFRWDDLRFEK